MGDPNLHPTRRMRVRFDMPARTMMIEPAGPSTEVWLKTVASSFVREVCDEFVNRKVMHDPHPSLRPPSGHVVTPTRFAARLQQVLSEVFTEDYVVVEVDDDEVRRGGR